MTEKKITVKKPIFKGFNNHINGSYGSFETPSGKVNYLQVTAKITTKGVSLEDDLASKLVPVREILDPKKMNFGQLLQRDLDDHRVATNLVPYILNGNNGEPSYFPPIQAVLLPFEVSDDSKLPEPMDSFGEFIPEVTEDDDMGLFWKGYQFGESYRFQKLSFKDDGTPLNIRQGKLSWHDKRAKLVVIDGQHRAMAMLAIYRTLHSSWRGAGSQYRHFYEGNIKRIFNENPDLKERLSDGIEYPVTVTWFDTQHHKAARKLFVDVNKNAKPPTKSRLILLGESRLSDIFTRVILNQLRNEESSHSLPIYAIEYDHSEFNTSQTGRWSSLINIEMLKSVVYKSVWGPNKYIENLALKISSGRDNTTELDLRFREQLQLKKWLDENFEDEAGESFERDEIGHTNFPKSKISELEDKFFESWGSCIIYILSEFLPYKTHIKALDSLKRSWEDSVDNEAALAHEAIFDGVGLYWTLRDSYLHWVDTEEKDLKPDTVKAWDVIKKKELEFYQQRAKLYLSENDKYEVVQDMYSKTNTYACFLGVTMGVASIAEQIGYKSEDLVQFTQRFVLTINNWLEKKVQRKRRKLFLSSKIDSSFNELPKLDQPYWVYFRYFWFEVANASVREGGSKLLPVEEHFVAEQLPRMRDFYYSNIIYAEQKKALRKVSDDTGDIFEKQVEEKALKRYSKILTYWFDELYEKSN